MRDQPMPLCNVHCGHLYVSFEEAALARTIL
jgi:hypothetical protein